MAQDSIDVRIRYLQEGAEAVSATLKNLTNQFNNLTRVNASMVMSTGKLAPNFATQALAINQLSGAAKSAGQDLVSLKQQGSMFSQIFTGRSSQNVQSLINQFGGASSAMKLMGGQASWLSTRMKEELGKVQAVSNETTGSLRNLTAPERFRIMGHVIGQEMSNASQNLLNMGKNMQWVGRQMTVGLTLPILLGAKSMVMSFLTLNKAQTEFQKYMIQNGATTQQAMDAFDTTKMGNLSSLFEDIAVKTGLYTDEVTNLGAAWVAAGYDVQTAVPQFTMLTAQLDLLAQGEIDQQQSIELIRSVQKSWNLDTADTIDQIKKLNLIAGTTSLTLGEIADSIPLASSAASLLGITASQLGALFAGMREKGVTASQAANTLKFSINRIVNPTDKATESFQNFFDTNKAIQDLFFGRNGQPKGLEGFKQLAEMFGTLNQEQQGALAGQMFGGYRFDRMLKLMASIREQGSQFGTAIDIAAPSQQAAAAAAEAWQNQVSLIQDSAAQAFKVMKTEFIAIAQKIGGMIWPYVNKAGNAIIKLLDAFVAAPDFVKGFIVAMGAVLAAIGPVIFISGQLIEAFASVKKVMIDMPWNKFFGMKVNYDPFGLARMAEKTNNPLLQIMAGIPLAEDQVAQMGAVTQASLAKTTASLQLMGITLDENTVRALKMNAAIAGGINPDVASMLPFMGPGGQSLLNQESPVRLQRIEDIKNYAGDSRADVADVLGRQGVTFTQQDADKMLASGGQVAYRDVKSGSFLAEELVAQKLGLSVEDLRALQTGEKSLFEIVTSEGSKFTTVSANDMSLLQKISYDKNAGGFVGTRGDTSKSLTWNLVSSAFGLPKEDMAAIMSGEKSLLSVAAANGTSRWVVATADEVEKMAAMAPADIEAIGAALVGGESLSAAIGTAMTTELAAGAEEAVVKAETIKMSFWQKIKALFTSGSPLKVLSGSQTGTETAGLFEIVFGSPAAILGIGAALAVLIKNWQSIWKGLKPAIDALGRSWGSFIKKLVSGVQAFVSGKSATEETANAFEAFGQILGVVITNLSTVLQGLISAIAFLAGNTVRAMEAGFVAVINTFRALTGQAGAFKDALHSIGAIINPFNTELSTLQRVIALVVAGFVAWKAAAIGLLIVEKIQAAITFLVTATTAFVAVLRGVAAGAITAAEGMEAFTTALAAAEIAAGDVVQGIIALVAVGVGMFALFHKTDQVAQELAQSNGEVVDSLTAIINASKEGDSILSALQQNMTALSDEASNLSTNLTGFDFTHFGSIDFSTNTADLQSQLEDFKQQQAELIKSGSAAEQELYGPQLQSNIDYIEGQLSKIAQYQNQINTSVNTWIGGLEQANLTLPQMKETAKALKTELQNVGQALYFTPVGSDKYNELIAKQALIKGELDALTSSGLYQKSMATSLADKWDEVTGAVDGAGNAMKKSQEYIDALSNEMQQMAGDVQNAFMSQFDAQAQAQEDALSERQSNATDSLEADQERRQRIFDKDADARLNAVQKKIDAIQKEQDKEDWAQQQAEYRKEKQRLIDAQSMSEAMAFAERMKAIHEGRYDDARILQLQQLSTNSDFNNQMNDLDKKHEDDVKSHRADRRTTRLQKEKDALQKQIDNQRDALQKQFDLEKKALQKRQDLQTKMLQEQLDNERQFLQNMFSELQENMPKNKKEFEKYWSDVKDLAKREGINVNGIMKQYADQWHQSLKQGLLDSVDDAARAAAQAGAAVGTGVNAGYDNVKKKSITPEDKQLISNLTNFLRNMTSAQASSMSPQQLARWVDTLTHSVMASVNSGTPIANIVNFEGRQAKNAFNGGDSGIHHTGGYIGGKAKADIPATLQEGEFVIRRDSVSKYGTSLMDKINKQQYHDGGLVQDALGRGMFDVETHAMLDASVMSGYQQTVTGLTRGALNMAGKVATGMARSLLQQKRAAARAARAAAVPSGVGRGQNYNYPAPPVGAGNVHPLTYSNQTWPVPSGVPSSGARASTSGTASEQNYYSRLLQAFKGWDVQNAGVYVRKYINGNPSDGWSQHSWGNAVDVVITSTANVLNSELAQAKMDMLAGWTAANHDSLRVATQLWRANADHMNHMHVDFWPQGTGTPPVMHQGGIYMGENKFNKLGNLRFQGPAILQAGETVLPGNVTNALNTIGKNGGSNTGTVEVEKNVVNINVEIKGDLYGDDQSYRRLYSTLERAGSQIARQRGLGHNSVVRVGVK